MVDAVGDAGTDDAEIVGDDAELRHPVRDLDSALAVTFPLPTGGEERRFDFAHGGDGALEALGERLPGELLEKRLAVKKVKVTRPAFHEKPDDILGASEAVGDLVCGGIGGGGP